MGALLSESERRFVDGLLKWDSSRRRLEWWLSQIVLLAAGTVIVVTIVVTITGLTDATVFGVLLPGLVTGLLLVGLYLINDRRVQERHRLADILRKLQGR